VKSADEVSLKTVRNDLSAPLNLVPYRIPESPSTNFPVGPPPSLPLNACSVVKGACRSDSKHGTSRVASFGCTIPVAITAEQEIGEPTCAVAATEAVQRGQHA
jgi:hypothetical protein